MRQPRICRSEAKANRLLEALINALPDFALQGRKQEKGVRNHIKMVPDTFGPSWKATPLSVQIWLAGRFPVNCIFWLGFGFVGFRFRHACLGDSPESKAKICYFFRCGRHFIKVMREVFILGLLTQYTHCNRGVFLHI